MIFHHCWPISGEIFLPHSLEKILPTPTLYTQIKTQSDAQQHK